MKPVLILQHLRSDGPAYLATWLAKHGLPSELRCADDGQDFPTELSAHSALAILGGAMSTNDPLPSLRRAEALVRLAVAQNIPVIGHCLGGQLIARALGATVGRSPQPEVGWHTVDWLPGAEQWFGPDVDAELAPEVFQWHFDAFGLPPGALPLASGRACPHQAFSVGERVLAMQFHVELDAEKLEVWLNDLDPDYNAALPLHPGTVQAPDGMRRDAVRRLAAQQRLADAVYGHWVGFVRR